MAFFFQVKSIDMTSQWDVGYQDQFFISLWWIFFWPLCRSRMRRCNYTVLPVCFHSGGSPGTPFAHSTQKPLSRKSGFMLDEKWGDMMGKIDSFLFANLSIVLKLLILSRKHWECSCHSQREWWESPSKHVSRMSLVPQKSANMVMNCTPKRRCLKLMH